MNEEITLKDKTLSDYLHWKEREKKGYEKKRGSLFFHKVQVEYICSLCGGKEVEEQEWKTNSKTPPNPLSETHKSFLQVKSCSKCREYLEGFSKEELINFILKRR